MLRLGNAGYAGNSFLENDGATFLGLSLYMSLSHSMAPSSVGFKSEYNTHFEPEGHEYLKLVI
jgi:hypothetical protein